MNAVLLATLENQSFPAFPWLGLLAFASFAGTGIASFAATRWIGSEAAERGVSNGDRWTLAAVTAPAALVIGVATIGPWAIPLGGIAALTVTYLFARQRDKLLPQSEQVLTRAGATTAWAALRERKSPVKREATGVAPQRHWKAMLGGLLPLLERLKRPTSGRRKPAAAESSELPFSFLKKDGTPALDAAKDDDELSQNVVQARRMMIVAMQAGATDVHFEPHEHDYIARLRVDGVLRDGDKIDPLMGKGIISAIKVIADMDITERRRPQDGTFSATLGDARYDIRVASTPTSYGEKLVLRLLQSSGGVMSSGLDSIGLRGAVLKQLHDVIHRPYGMFIVAGPTGSGKTTTVYASLSEIDSHTHNITTIEDPVEYRLDNITQIAVNTKAGVSFASILRSVLRQDPDVLLVGEIRDKETAEIACQAALTGHFVFSTLHANDSVATVTRLLDLGLEPTLVQTALTAVLGQRLARRLCPKCKEPCPPPDSLARKFLVKGGPVSHIYRERGCEHCGGTGYRGRLGIHELLIVDDSVRELITSQPSVTDLAAAAKKAGTVSLKNDGLIKVLKGETSLNEVMRVTG